MWLYRQCLSSFAYNTHGMVPLGQTISRCGGVRRLCYASKGRTESITGLLGNKGYLNTADGRSTPLRILQPGETFGCVDSVLMLQLAWN